MKRAKARRLIIWAYFGIHLAIGLVWLLTVGRKSKGLLKERLHPGPGAKDGLLFTSVLNSPPILAHFIIAYLDLRRYHWTNTIPLRLQFAGLMSFIGANLVIFWATAVNPFFSSVVRIQRERGHRVITTGPYKYIRHPGYLAAIVEQVSSGFVLGSWLSILPTLAYIPIFVRRTIIEDHVLTEELEGYKEYVKTVRYRLIPGIW